MLYTYTSISISSISEPSYFILQYNTLKHWSTKYLM